MLSFQDHLRALMASGSGGAVASAAVRSRISGGDGAVSANNVTSTRIREKANVAVTSPWIEIWNGWVNATLTTAAQEVGATDAGAYRAAFMTGAASGSSLNKTGGTITPITWANAGNCVPGYIWKLDGTAGDSTAFAAAGGVLSGDNLTLTLPSGWYARSDSMAGVTLSGEYFIQYEETKPTAGVSRRANVGVAQRLDLGDATRLQATTGTMVYAANWTGATQTDGAVIGSPTAVYGTSAANTKVVGIAGDSIITETGDFNVGTTVLHGDADGCLAFGNRALNAGGYSWVRTSVPSTKALNIYTYGGHAIRKLMLRYCSAVITDMGHNDRSLPWANSIPNGYYALYKWYWNELRAACMGGTGRIVSTDLLPKTTSTDSWATTVNQTDNSGGVQYVSINPFFQAGSFVPANGDPDAAFSIYNAIQNTTYLTPAGFTDVAAQKFPSNAVAFGGSRDGTHTSGPLYAAIASQMTPQLPTLLGF